MTAAVAITGMGVIAPAGAASEALHTALVHAADEPLRFVAPRLERLDGGEGLEVAGFTPEAYLGPRNLRPLDRPACLLASAARLALLDSGRDSAPSEEAEIGLVVGTMFSTVH